MTNKEKLGIYESALHEIQALRSVSMDYEKLSRLMDLICSWSYSHRCGNGELTDKQRRMLVNKSLRKLRDRNL